MILRSLAIVMLGAVCLVVMACQTAGTSPSSQAAADAQGQSSQTAAGAQATSSGAAAAPRALRATRSAGSSNQNEGVVLPAISALVKQIAAGAKRIVGNLTSTVAAQREGAVRAIGYAAVAVMVVAVVAIASVRVRRHRKMAPSSRGT